jgi:hypothetical protein
MFLDFILKLKEKINYKGEIKCKVILLWLQIAALKLVPKVAGDPENSSESQHAHWRNQPMTARKPEQKLHRMRLSAKSLVLLIVKCFQKASRNFNFP